MFRCNAGLFVMRRWWVVCLLLTFVGHSSASLARSVEEAGSTPKRLSDWLGLQVPRPTVGETHWRVPAERLSQARARDQVLAALPAHLDALRVTLNALPLTGRLPLTTVDANALLADPAIDPVIRWQQVPTVFPAKMQVAVLIDNDRACDVEVAHPVAAYALWTECAKALLVPVGARRLWVATPDMRQLELNLNTTDRDTLIAPGSWVWAPSPDLGMADEVSREFTRFLATQEPPAYVLGQLASVSYGLGWVHLRLQGSAGESAGAVPLPRTQPVSRVADPYPRALWAMASTVGAEWEKDAFSATGWQLIGVQADGALLRLVFTAGAASASWSEGTDSLMSLLNESYGQSIRRFDITLKHDDVVLRRGLFDRTEWALQRAEWIPPSLRLAVETPMPPVVPSELDIGDTWTGQLRLTPNAWFESGAARRTSAYALSLDLEGSADWGTGFGLSGRFQIPMARHLDDNFVTRQSDGKAIPARQRADWSASAGRVSSLALSRSMKWSPNWLAQTYVGWLSPEIAGFGSAVLYKLQRSPWSFGLQLNRLHARPQDASLQWGGARVTSGLLSTGLDWPVNRIKLYAYGGKFVRGDRGLTVGFSKGIVNGVDWSTEVTHSSSDSKPLWVVTLRVPFESLSGAWRSGGGADLVLSDRRSDSGSRLRWDGSATDVSKPYWWQAQ